MRKSKFEKIIANDDAERTRLRQKFYDAISDSGLSSTKWYWTTIAELERKGFSQVYYDSSNFDKGIQDSYNSIIDIRTFIDEKIAIIDKVKKKIERNKENWERFKENSTMFLVAQDYYANNDYLFAYEINKTVDGIEVNGFDSEIAKNIVKKYNYIDYNLRPMEYYEFENFYIPYRCKMHSFKDEEDLVNYVNYLRNLWHESMDKINEEEYKKYKETDEKYYF